MALREEVPKTSCLGQVHPGTEVWSGIALGG